MTNSTDLELLRKALIEARDRKLNALLSSEPDDIPPSLEHTQKMEQIIASFDRAARKRKKWVIGLVAAALALALAGCAAYVNRKKIAGFVEELFDQNSRVVAENQPDTSASVIANPCTLKYVPEGYQLTFEENDFGIFQIWKNAEDEKITFKQAFIDSTYLYDIENSYSLSSELNGVEIYSREWEDKVSYLWSDDAYLYNLTVTDDFSEEEILKLISNIRP